MSAQNNPPFGQYLIFTLVGALISLGSSLVVTTVQSRAQMRQAILEHQMTARSNLEQVVQGDAAHFLFDALDLENRAATSDFSNSREREDFHQRKLILDQEYIALIGKANVNISIVNAVFGSKIGRVDFSTTELVSATPATEREPHRTSDEREKNIAELTDARRVVFEKLLKGLQLEIEKLPTLEL